MVPIKSKSPQHKTLHTHSYYKLEVAQYVKKDGDLTCFILFPPKKSSKENWF